MPRAGPRAVLVVLVAATVARAGGPPELRLDGTLRPGPAPGGQYRTQAAAFDGGTFLVWVDSRSSDAWPDVYAGVVHPGAAFPGGATAVATGPGAQESPAVGCGDDVCLVAWASGQRIFARRFDVAGRPLDLAALAISEATPDYSSTPGVAFEGGAFRVLWVNASLWSRRVELDGGLGAAEALLTPAVEWPRVVAGSRGWLVAYAPGAGRLAYRPGLPDGGLGAEVLVGTLSTYYDGVTAAAGQSGFLVGHVALSPNDLLVARTDPLGGLLDPAPLKLGENAGPPLALAARGDAWVAAVSRNGDVYGTLVPPSGDAGAPALWDSRQGHETEDCALAGGAAPLLAFSTGFAQTQAKLRVRRLSGLPPAPEELPPAGPNAQSQPAAAFGRDGFLTAWVDERVDGGLDVVVRAVDERGTGFGLPADLAATAAAELSPAIAWDGQHYVVVWREADEGGSDLRAARVDALGVPRGAAVTIAGDVSAPWERPAIAAGPRGAVVAWSSWTTGGYGLFTSLLADGGASNPLSVAPGPAGLVAPALALRDTTLAVAASSPTRDVVEVRFLGVTGAPLAAQPVVLQAQGGDVHGVDIATDGERFLVVWAAKAPKPYTVFGQRLGSAGQLLDATPRRLFDAPQVVPDSPDLDGVPRVTFDGRDFLVGFSRLSPTTGGDVVMVRVRWDGTTMPMAVASGGAQDEGEVSFATATAGRTLVAYRTFDETLGVSRVAMRLLADVALGGRCFAASECSSGLCDAGVCCELDGGCAAAPSGEDGGADGGAGPRRAYRVGCDCGAAGGTTAVLVGLALALLGAARRRPLVR